MSKRFVILDRDGTINVDRDHLSDPEGLELIPGAAEGLRELRALGLGLVVLTNQSAVGRGMVDEDGLRRIHRRLAELLSEDGVELDAIYHCPHLPDDGCACRKPGVELVERAAADLDFDPSRAFLVGDHASDVEMGRRVGATTILVLTGHGQEESGTRADHVAKDLEEAAAIIRGLLGPP